MRKNSVSRQGRMPDGLWQRGMGSSLHLVPWGWWAWGALGTYSGSALPTRDLRGGKCSLVAVLLPWSPRGCCHLGHTPDSAQLTARQGTCLESSTQSEAVGLTLGAQGPQQPDTCSTWQGCFGSKLPVQAGVGGEGAQPERSPHLFLLRQQEAVKLLPHSPPTTSCSAALGWEQPSAPAPTFCNLSGNW